MKWHPIVNGDLSGIQQQETILFTLFDERQNENYVTTGWILENEGELQVLNGNTHFGNSADWCIFGKDIKAAIESLHMKRHSGNTFV